MSAVLESAVLSAVLSPCAGPGTVPQRCPRCCPQALSAVLDTLSAAARAGCCPRCCSRRRGRGGVSSLSPRRCWGRVPWERPGFAPRRKSRLRGWHESCAVLPVFPPPLPTPLFSCRCGFDAVLGGPPSQPEVGEQPGALPRAAPEQAWRENLPGESRADCGLPSGWGAPSGVFPLTCHSPASSGCAVPLLGVAGAASPHLPCPG